MPDTQHQGGLLQPTGSCSETGQLLLFPGEKSIQWYKFTNKIPAMQDREIGQLIPHESMIKAWCYFWKPRPNYRYEGSKGAVDCGTKIIFKWLPVTGYFERQTPDEGMHYWTDPRKRDVFGESWRVVWSEGPMIRPRSMPLQVRSSSGFTTQWYNGEEFMEKLPTGWYENNLEVERRFMQARAEDVESERLAYENMNKSYLSLGEQFRQVMERQNQLVEKVADLAQTQQSQAKKGKGDADSKAN